MELRVTKRTGELQEVSFDKIMHRVKTLGTPQGTHEMIGLPHISYTSLVMKVIEQLFDTIPTCQIDELTAEQCASMATIHSDYSILASRIVISNHQKNTEASFSATMHTLASHMSPAFLAFVQTHATQLDAMIDHSHDYFIDYFGFKTLELSYLFRLDGNRVIERVQHLWMRVAIGILPETRLLETSLAEIQETYFMLSHKYYTHATPTLFNAGTHRRPQLSSCFLLTVAEDSLDGIYSTLAECANISKSAGGIGLDISNVRATGTYIHGTNGKSTGIVPMLRVFNETARYVNQGGKRPGAFAIYLEPWHADVEDFLNMRKNHGDDDRRARDLFYAMWTPDLFMERVRSDSQWSLMCPHICPHLNDTYGKEFEKLYIEYESDAKNVIKTVSARSIWLKIMDSQMETGMPYMLYKDAANLKSNQKHSGIIRSSNLCCEIMEHTSDKETAVCNLASVALPMCVDEETKTFNYSRLHAIVKVVARNLNHVIDSTFYPDEKSRFSNERHRPIGIGVQGLADVFAMMDLAFFSEEAKRINALIFETMYHAALETSNELAMRDGPYSAFFGSPASRGILQFDLWNVTPSSSSNTSSHSSSSSNPSPFPFAWEPLKQSICKHGLRNSLLMAPMPTASTSQILGFNECFEPFTSNLYSRGTLAGEFIIINKYLIKELNEAGQWNETVKNNIILHKGSVQQLSILSEHQKNKYKTVWEISMKHVIDMAADRGAFICQSQSMNLWQEDPTYKSLNAMHFYAWGKGLKTGMYYLRRKAKHAAQQFTLAPPVFSHLEKKEEVCESCSA
jgi:ribonucleoside-diphosphate reductase alpha chain